MKKMKKRELLLPIIKARRLLQRLDSHHPKYESVRNTLATMEVGQHGESLLDYPLSHLNHPKLHLYESLRLPITKKDCFQIDFLLITPQLIILIESKYIKGEIWIGPHQMVRELGGQTEIFQNAIQQVNNQSYHLLSLLRKHSFPVGPYRNFVAFTNSQAKINIESSYQRAHKFIFRTDSIREQVDYAITQTTKEIFSEKDMNNIARVLNKLHTPDNSCVLEKFGIEFEELKKGVYCTQCKEFSMIKKWKWKCRHCNKTDNKSYIEALLDYYYLAGEEITSKQCMEFLNLNSLSVAIKKLKRIQCKHSITGHYFTFHLNKNKLIRMLKGK